MQWAIDRQNLVDTVYSGQATPGNGFISPYYKRYYESFEGDPEVGYTFDPDKARQILAEGGWACPAEDEEGVCTKDGQQARVRAARAGARTRRTRTPPAGSWRGPKTSASRSSSR